jgi:hypothetical protein
MKFGVGEQFLNAATLLTYHSHEKKPFLFDTVRILEFSLFTRVLNRPTRAKKAQLTHELVK